MKFPIGKRCILDAHHMSTIVNQQLHRRTVISDQSSSPSIPPYPTRVRMGTYAILGVVSAIISLFVVPEIFGAASIVLGAYTWRKEQGNLGIYIVLFGIVCMLIGLYFTAFFILGDLLPS